MTDETEETLEVNTSAMGLAHRINSPGGISITSGLSMKNLSPNHLSICPSTLI